MNRRNRAYAPIAALMALFAWLPACSSATSSEADVEPNSNEVNELLRTEQSESAAPTSCTSDWNCKSGTYCCMPCGATTGTCAAGCPQVVCP
ncbi:hypothetical protein LVJ94_26985 [Pendulispora rubella]|uniref:Uncharacterized protein n=1 Tax=Pendulispora rubella TaxID=2741070 RepID=A0ABZ2KU94_9BACT